MHLKCSVVITPKSTSQLSLADFICWAITQRMLRKNSINFIYFNSPGYSSIYIKLNVCVCVGVCVFLSTEFIFQAFLMIFM